MKRQNEYGLYKFKDNKKEQMKRQNEHGLYTFKNIESSNLATFYAN